MDPDPARPMGTTRLGFLSGLTRRAAQALPQGMLPVPVDEADELPPPGEMIEPYLSDEAFLEDVEGAKHEDGLQSGGSGRAASSSRSTGSISCSTRISPIR